MNSLTFLIISVVVLWLGYRFYGTAFENFLGIDHTKKTPAHTKFDGVDYVPAKHWLILFGHHFSSIAGAGPIIGPVLAVTIWGWGPSIVIILLGTIFIGGIHDFGSLFLSMRNHGHSIPDISEEVISKKARIIFSWFVLLSLVVVMAVFLHLCTKTLIAEPRIVLPSLGLIPVALLVGVLIYRLRVNFAISTVIGLALLVALILMGEFIPVALPSGSAPLIWTVILLAYCFIASVLPVNILLQPRDYLASYLLFFGIAAGFLGILTTRPNFTIPVFIHWNNSKEGPLWPMLFVTIACGAISGFHSLISAGTTSKQIASEHDAKRIGYGAMVLEAVLAAIAIIAVAAGFKSVSELNASMASGGPIGAFGAGFGYITRFILGKYGTFIAIIFLNAFIFTTLDSATRISRYILQELFNTLDRYLATALIVLVGGWIALSGQWRMIWPIFGAANQLVAALTLIVMSSWLLSRRKHVKFTLVPAIFMLITSIGALGWQFGKFFQEGNWFLVVIDAGLVVLALAMLVEVRKWIWTLAGSKGKKKA
ncbi:MAG: carbon starvation protein A [Candidatus Omnitrophica bacterium]|nr:carbon starvation protein A [Candidatus Omnitrophota bacterium]